VSAHKIHQESDSSQHGALNSSANALIQAIQDESIRSNDDKRLLMLQQFLEYVHSKRKFKTLDANSLSDKMLLTIAQVRINSNDENQFF
jgi:hypothetical protein